MYKKNVDDCDDDGSDNNGDDDGDPRSLVASTRTTEQDGCCLNMIRFFFLHDRPICSAIMMDASINDDHQKCLPQKFYHLLMKFVILMLMIIIMIMMMIIDVRCFINMIIEDKVLWIKWLITIPIDKNI